MYDEKTQIIMDALVAQIKNLKLSILIKDSEIESLKKELKEKESKEVANG